MKFVLTGNDSRDGLKPMREPDMGRGKSGGGVITPATVVYVYFSICLFVFCVFPVSLLTCVLLTVM